MEGNKDARKLSREIDKQLQMESRKRKSELTLLMLGPGASGKSTFCKQMKILHLFGFTESEKEKFRWIIHTNVIDAICTLIEHVFKLKLHFDSDENEKSAKHILKIYRAIEWDSQYSEFGEVHSDLVPEEIEVDGVFAKVFTLDEDLAEEISVLWKDSGIRGALARKNQFNFDDSAPFYLEALDRISKESYVPSDLDILRARLKTTSVVETTFDWEGSRFRLVDVGGQRGERKKWLPLFGAVTAVIFCVGLSDYDTVLEEDGKTNRMKDALSVFKEVSNSVYLAKVPIILFLNKKDLFEEKIKRVDLNVCFPEYKGGCDYDKAVKFIQRKFTAHIDSSKKVFVKVTVATDTKNITTVWKAVREILVGKAIENAIPGYSG